MRRTKLAIPPCLLLALLASHDRPPSIALSFLVFLPTLYQPQRFELRGERPAVKAVSRSALRRPDELQRTLFTTRSTGRARRLERLRTVYLLIVSLFGFDRGHPVRERLRGSQLLNHIRSSQCKIFTKEQDKGLTLIAWSPDYSDAVTLDHAGKFFVEPLRRLARPTGIWIDRKLNVVSGSRCR
jgi:hypothetical protein